MLRFLTAGESHGPALTAIIEGFPAGVEVPTEKINAQLERRQSTYGRGGRMKIEKDKVKILSGVRGGLTLGSPIALQIMNLDWKNWREVMSGDANEYVPEKAAYRALTRPRPGHADLAGGLKYGHHKDLRNVLERASARETAVRVAVGTVGRILIESLGCNILSHVVQIGRVEAPEYSASHMELAEKASASSVGCADPEAASAMIEEIDRAAKSRDTLGGVIEVICTGLPPGLGSYVHWDRRLDSRLAAAVLGIPSVKGVDFGLGFRGAGVFGSDYHDEIRCNQQGKIYRSTNRAGGLEGGVSNGEPLVLRAVVKPVPTLGSPLASVDLKSKEESLAAIERSDTCIVPAAAVIAEAVVAWEIAAAVLDKFGGDTLAEIQEHFQQYLAYIRQF
ncbi:MAG TPA: chorismate synthase [Syntrophomonadaceae bacterium]|nr:chorismate synthase [Syntrophomonadaceae bacterium]